jgi:hypothetical protein
MENKKVEIFLNTPLFRFKYMLKDEEKTLLENAVRISGKVSEEKGSGLAVKVDSISNMKISESDLPFDELFIPFAKIDYIIIL